MKVILYKPNVASSSSVYEYTSCSLMISMLLALAITFVYLIVSYATVFDDGIKCWIGVGFLILSTFNSYTALGELKVEAYYKVSYFWYMFIPFVNIFTQTVIVGYCVLYDIKEFMLKYINIYMDQSRKEYENMLIDIRDTNRRTNEKIRNMKHSSGDKTDALVLEIMDSHVELLNILKS